MSIKKLSTVVVVGALVVTTGGALAEDLTIKLGFAAPLTGAQGHLGKDVENGARLAVADINANPPTIGGKKVTVELQVEDDQADPKQATAAAQRLIDKNVVGVVGHYNSGATIPVSKLYSAAGIPQISPSSTNPAYTHQGFATAFRLVANDAQLGSTMGKYAVQSLKAKKIAVIDDRTAYGQGVAAEFEKSAIKAGAQIVSRQYTTDKATDFMAILTSLKSTNPDVVFFGGMDAQGGPMLRQMAQLSMNAKFMGGDGICSSELPKLAGDAVNSVQVYCAEAGGITSEYTSGMEKFRTRYKEKYGQEVVIYAPYGYDAVMVLVEAMKKANSSDPKVYLPVLKKTDHKGVIGHTRFDSNGDILDGALTLYTYKQSQRVSLGVQR